MQDDEKKVDQARIKRLLHLVQEIRNEPNQSLQKLQTHFGISRSQFYKDKDTLAQLGFAFNYRKSTGFQILEDRLTPIIGLSLSDRLILMFALENLCAYGEGHLAARAVEVGRKLAGGLDEPFREQLTACFDQVVTNTAFGVQPEVLTLVRQAITENRRINIYYQRSEDWSSRWREIDPRRIYLRQRALYLYAQTIDESPPKWKVFRMSRIKEVKYTGICINRRPDDDDGFYERQKNAFMAFIGTSPKTIKLRFTGNAKHFIQEIQWHQSQEIIKSKDSVILTLSVAEPQEVIRWARQFGNEVEVLAVEE